MPNIKALLEYDGTDFAGFQKQPNVPTIQGEIERSLAQIFQDPKMRVVGAGRTDAGVHATGQVVSFQSPDAFPFDKIFPAMNGVLPLTIRVKKVDAADSEFHARYSAKSRSYVYVLLNRIAPSAVLGRYSWHLPRPLDLEAMRVAAKAFVGKMDFVSFGLPDRVGGSTVREVTNFSITRRRDALIFRIVSNAFLRGMARAMVGTLVEVGLGKRRPEEVSDMLASCDRRLAGASAPPRGLFLTRVEY